MPLLSLVPRPVLWTAVLFTCSSLTNAGPLYITIQGYIPTLTGTTEKLVNGPSGTISDTPSTQTSSNIPFSGQFVLDSARLGLVTPDSSIGPLALRSFTDNDPVAPVNGSIGVDTEEWISGMLSLGGTIGATLPFNRQVVAQTPAGADVLQPFNGFERVEYMDGRDNLPETGDEFGFAVQHGYTYTLNGPYTPGQEVGVGEFSFVSLGIVSTFDFNLPGVIHFFGPGAPSSFIWADPVPGGCVGSDCDDGFFTAPSRSFFSYSVDQAFAVDPAAGIFEFDTTTFSGSLIFTQVDASPVAAPEPASAALLLLAAGLWVRRALRRES
jgi:hypothetical protein